MFNKKLKAQLEILEKRLERHKNIDKSTTSILRELVDKTEDLQELISIEEDINADNREKLNKLNQKVDSISLALKENPPKQKKKGGKNNAWTDKEDANIWSGKYTMHYLAKKLNRSESAVYQRSTYLNKINKPN